jgi:predicted dehydrogenase
MTPELDLTPPRPRRSGRGIGLVGCGWVGAMQLDAYRAAGYSVVGLTDHTAAKAEALRAAHFPHARVHPDTSSLLADDAVEVLDIATHLDGRPAIIERALRSGRHVLTQKPFTDDLAEGERLARLADDVGRVLAVNHNGRWAPHFAVLLAAARAGALGAVTSADFSVHWPHDAIVEDKPGFATMPDLVLYDFGIHWFDVVAALLPDEPTAVYAQVGRRKGQRITAPTQAQVLVAYPNAQVSLVFRAGEPRRERGAYRVDGTVATLVHEGASLGGRHVDMINGPGPDESVHRIPIDSDWFGPGMAGAMGELLCAIEEGRRPHHCAQSSLRGLSLCFAALESVRTGAPTVPGAVRTRPPLR